MTNGANSNSGSFGSLTSRVKANRVFAPVNRFGDAAVGRRRSARPQCANTGHSARRIGQIDASNSNDGRANPEELKLLGLPSVAHLSVSWSHLSGPKGPVVTEPQERPGAMKQSAITDATFAAFLHCETKAYLFREGATGTRSDVDPWQLRLARTFKDSATEWLRSTVSDNECFVGMPPARILEQGLYRIILDPLMETSEIHSHPDALWLMPSGLETSGVLYSPVRFIRHEKLSTIDKLMLAFDAIALACVTGRTPRSGKLIHGSQFTTVTVPLAKLMESARSSLTKVVGQQASGRPPLVLNKHCQVCEFQSRCRKVAVEMDDLSLLANMTAKERKKQNDKGIFTVAQLSYTFRARRRRRFKSSQATKHELALKAAPPVNKSIQAKENRPALCPKCNSTKFYRNGRFSKVVYDLRFTRAGVRRWVVRYCFNRYQCRNCSTAITNFRDKECMARA